MIYLLFLMYTPPPIHLFGYNISAVASKYSSETILTIYLILGIFIILLVIVSFEYRTRILRKNNKDLRDKEIAAKEVLQQRNLLRSRNKNIEDSLQYAQRIQQAMFTTEKEINRLFPHSFVIQRPKDIVSGDFFWAREIDGKVFFTVADCTGHGVPGAFMSLIGLEFFRQIIVEREIYKPSDILSEMNNYFNKVFDNLEELSLKDGMDLAFCTYYKEERKLEFSGAFSSIYVIRNNEIIEIKGDKIIVGPDYGLGQRLFSNQQIKIEKDDIIYLFTDGYVDQFGGPEGKKFKYRRFRHLLLTIHKLPMDQQKRILNENIVQWMGNIDQIDDIMILGIKPVNYSSS